MKTLSFFAFLFLAAAVHAEGFFFRPSDWALGTEFPAKPEQSAERTARAGGDVVEMIASFVVSPDEALSLTRVLNPVAVSGPHLAAAYNNAKNGMLRASGARLVSQETITIVGHESRRYVCEFNGGGLVSEQRMVIIGNELFIFNYLHAKNSATSPEARAFFDKIAADRAGD